MVLLMVILAGFLVVPTVMAKEKSASISYQTHVQNVGWQDWKVDGQMAGTTGRALRLEGIKINLDLDGYEGGVEYQTHVQNIGWQGKVENGEMSGTSGQALRLEAIRINLTGEVADNYSVCYRVHAQNFGWLGWACDGSSAGTATYGYRLEGIEIKMVKKTDLGNVGMGDAYQTRMLKYRTHVQNVGWQGYKWDGEMSGTSGQALRLEGINISLGDIDPMTGGITYRTHVQNVGWQDWKSNGEMSGTSGRSLRLEGIEIKLTGDIAICYDVYYRTHVQNVGWQDWKKNGEMAGTSGQALRLEGIEIKLMATDRCGVGSIGPIDDGGENGGDEGGNQGDENNGNGEAKLVHFTEEAPIVEASPDAFGPYDYGVIAKYADENLYVDGFEFEIFENEENYSPWVASNTPKRTAWDAENQTSLVNAIEYDWTLAKIGERTGRQEIRARSYGVVNGERQYSAYSEPFYVEYDNLNIDLDGGEMPELIWPYKEGDAVLVGAGKDSYFYGQEYKLLNPNKYGYKFMGWTGSNGEVPQKDVYIVADTTGELNYTANWEEVPEEYYLTLETPNLVRDELPDGGRAGTMTDYRLKVYYDDVEYYVDGFEIYRTDEDGENLTLIETTTHGEAEHNYYDESGRRHMSDSEVNRSLEMEIADREMYYKARAFKMVGDEKKYSRFSDVLKVESGIMELDLDGGTLPEYVTADGVPNIHNGVGYVYEREVGDYVSGKMYVYNQEYRLAEPEKEGYTFAGWTGSNGEVPEKNVRIAAGTTGVVRYKANWIEGESELNVARPIIVWKDSATMAVRVQIGNTNHGDYANGFELGYSSLPEGEFVKYSEWCSVSPYSSGVYGSLIMECSMLPSEINSDIYLAARGYRDVEGGRIYGEWSEPVLVRVQSVEFDLNGGSEDGMGMGYGTADEEPFAIIEPTAKGYILGKRYKVAQPIREGHTFAGWTGSNGEMPEVNLYIEAETDESLHYKANWTKNS